MELKLGAAVYTDAEGKHVGKLRYLVMNPTTKAFESMVVERGFLGHHNVEVPLHHISEIRADGDTISLALSEDELHSFHPFHEHHDAHPTAAADSSVPPISHVARHETEGKVVLKGGERVLDSEDHVIGTLSYLLTDPEGRLQWLDVREGIVFFQEANIPAEWVQTYQDGAVRLQYSKHEVADKLKKLIEHPEPDWKPAPRFRHLS